MTLKIEKAIEIIESLPTQETIFVAKGEKLGTTAIDLLVRLYPGLELVERNQRMIRSQDDVNVVINKDVMENLTLPLTRSVWGIIPLNQLV